MIMVSGFYSVQYIAQNFSFPSTGFLTRLSCGTYSHPHSQLTNTAYFHITH